MSTTGLLGFISTSGSARMRRLPYLVCVSIAVPLLMFFGMQAVFSEGAVAATTIIGLTTGIATLVVATIQRLRDVDCSGKLAGLLAVPFLGQCILIWIAIMPGSAGPNRFGVAPKTLPLWSAFLMASIVAISAGGVCAFIYLLISLRDMTFM